MSNDEGLGKLAQSILDASIAYHNELFMLEKRYEKDMNALYEQWLTTAEGRHKADHLPVPAWADFVARAMVRTAK